MKGSLRQRSPGAWEITVDLRRDPLGRRQRKDLTVRGTKAQASMSVIPRDGSIDSDITVSPIILTKGLEFDAVIVANAQEGNFA